MKQLVTAAAMLVFAATTAFAHGGNEHVRGVVTQISAQSITVQVADKTTRTLALTDKTIFQRSGKTAHPADIVLGGRVVIDAPEHTANAVLIRIAAPVKASPQKPSR